MSSVCHGPSIPDKLHAAMLQESGSLQTTLAGPVEIAGNGLHSAVSARLRIEPAEGDSGIVFHPPAGPIPARLEHVSEATRCTAISRGEARVETIEHIMAGLYGLGVTNATIKLEGGIEAPCLDGSALPVVRAIQEVGVRAIPGTQRRAVEVRRPLCVEQDGSIGMVLPSPTFRATVLVDFPHPVGREIVDVVDVAEAFVDRVAPARTPGFVREWDMLKSMGLALGATADNVLPIFDDEYGADLRVPNEVGTHKVVDLIGDLALVGADLRAHVITQRGGHALNHAIGRAVLEAAGED
ncbi:MAG: UDP-3-O-acyl-N-acetylglucosamine deacetylase [Armatimonadia bacterium]|nr:UDP-3-O-acyl-N-acetylglucosamine deacetylase [Armatimonadia bacterium]